MNIDTLIAESRANGGLCAAFGAVLLSLIVLWLKKNRQRKGREAPEAGGAWPLVGHLPLLAGPQPPHIVLGNMSDKYGPLFGVRLGLHRALVVCSWEIAKELYTTHDRIFASRPKSLAADLMGYNYAMFGFAPYGPYWRHIRKIATLELLSSHRLSMVAHLRHSEVNAYIRAATAKAPVIEMKKWFGDLTLDVIFRMVVGKRFVEAMGESTKSSRRRKAIREFFELSGIFVVADALPFLRWLDVGGHEKAMKTTATELDSMLQEWLSEHKQKRVTISAPTAAQDRDFMDVMLSTLADAEDLPSYDSDTIIKATCLALILGATDTTTTTLTWALSLLLNHPEALEKAQRELDTQVGRDRLVQESDMKKLPYLQAVLKETMRLYPAAPLGVAHEASEDCTVAGYHVPAYTRVFVNLTKIHRDPRAWSDPDQFRPDRFLSAHKHMDVRGQNFELIPFGSGRRVCPGISFALQIMELTLASLLHAFAISTPSGGPVDMTEALGMTNLKAGPLDVVVTPRLPARALLDG